MILIKRRSTRRLKLGKASGGSGSGREVWIGLQTASGPISRSRVVVSRGSPPVFMRIRMGGSGFLPKEGWFTSSIAMRKQCSLDLPGRKECRKSGSSWRRRTGALWFGGTNGLLRWDGEAVEDFRSDPLLAGASIVALAIGADGTLYGGTGDGRVFTYREGFSILGRPGDLERVKISSVLPLSPEEVWVTTLGQGLFLWKEGVWQRFGETAALPDLRLTGLARVAEDELWMGSLGGIFRVSRTALLDHVVDQGLLPSWLVLDHTDGMITRECVWAGQPSLVQGAEGDLWFPTTAGMAGVDPSQVRVNSSPPPVYFDSVEVDGVAMETGIRALECGAWNGAHRVPVCRDQFVIPREGDLSGSAGWVRRGTAADRLGADGAVCGSARGVTPLRSWQ